MEAAKGIIYRDRHEHGKRKKIKMVSAIDKNYLEETYKDMARKGWLIEDVKGIRDTYRPIESCELDFSVTFFQPVTQLDYPDYDKEETYQEFCEDGGWTLADKNERYFVYYKTPASKVLPIHTDPGEEYNSVWNALKKGEMFAFPILILLQLFQLWMGMRGIKYYSFYRSAGLSSVINPIILLIVCIGYMIPLVSWLIRNRKNVKENKPLIYSSYKQVKLRTRLYNVGLSVALLYIIHSGISMVRTFMPPVLLLISLVTFAIPFGFAMLLRIKIKRVKSKRSTNIIIMIVGFFVTWAIMVGIVFSLVGRIDFEKADATIPVGIPILTHEDLGTNLVFQPENIDRYSTLMVPLSFEYSSDHRKSDGYSKVQNPIQHTLEQGYFSLCLQRIDSIRHEFTLLC